MIQKDLLHLRIISSQKIIYEDDAVSVSSRNSAGNFDILASHANFLSIVENNPIEIIDKNYKKVSFKFSIAIIHNLNNKVNIYADISSSLKA